MSATYGRDGIATPFTAKTFFWRRSGCNTSFEMPAIAKSHLDMHFERSGRPSKQSCHHSSERPGMPPCLRARSFCTHGTRPCKPKPARRKCGMREPPFPCFCHLRLLSFGRMPRQPTISVLSLRTEHAAPHMVRIPARNMAS